MIPVPDEDYVAMMAAIEAVRDFVRNYGGDNDADRVRWKVLVAALEKVPE